VTPSAVIQSAVIQVKPGIGDVVWHLPFIRAIAAAAPGGQVTFLVPPSSGASELLQAEPTVAATVYFQHSGSELQRGVNLIRLVALLRRQRLRSLWILDRTRSGRRLPRRSPASPSASDWGSGRKACSSPIAASARNIFTIIRSTGCAP
jgi:ADP-heptose:LPS heptosyltransferase